MARSNSSSLTPLARPLPAVNSEMGSVADSPALLSPPGQGVLALPVAAGPGDEEIQPRPTTLEAAYRYGIDLAELAERRDYKGKPGTVLTIDLPVLHNRATPWQGLPSCIALVGVGQASAVELRDAGRALAQAAAGRGQVITAIGSAAPAATQRALVEGYLVGAQTLLKWTKKPDQAPKPGDLRLLGQFDRTALTQAQVAARATWLARDLTATPANLLSASGLAQQAQALGQEAGLKTLVWSQKDLVDQGFGAIAAVGQATPEGAHLVQLTYRSASAAATEPHLVLIGKGITFDAGGLDLKPAGSQTTMKTDMAGAAAVLAAILAIADLAVPLRVTALLPLAANLPGAAALRPGDVITAYGGRTVEIGNTDAEGRLVLADALAYASGQLAPDYLVDIATLTGAQRLALGQSTGAIFTPQDDFAKAVSEAGQAAGEDWWRLPLALVYAANLTSSVADLDNGARPVAGASRAGGAIAAALFLSQFAGSQPWAHLDIAGPARFGKDGTATGFGARSLVYLAHQIAVQADSQWH